MLKSDLGKQWSMLACKFCSQDRKSDLAELGTCMKVPGLSTQSNDCRKTSVELGATFKQDTKCFMPVVKAGVLCNKRSHCFTMNSWRSVLTNCTFDLNCAACEKLTDWPRHRKKKLSDNVSVKHSCCQWNCIYLATRLFGGSAHTLLSANCRRLRFNLAVTASPLGRFHKLHTQTIGCKPGFGAASLCGQ